MTTSAQALNEVLSYVNKRGDPKQRFLSCVADFLNLSGELAEVDALKQLYSVYLEIEKDISSVPLGDTEKQQLRNYLAPFKGIHNLAHVHMDVANAKNNFLKPDHLVGLMNVHMALSGHVIRVQLDSNALEIASDARSLASAVVASDLPDRLKYTLSKRLVQVAATIEHFGLFGSRELEEELEALLGTIAVYRDEGKSEETTSMLSEAYGVFCRSWEVLTKADQSVAASKSLLKHGQQLWELLPNLS